LSIGGFALGESDGRKEAEVRRAPKGSSLGPSTTARRNPNLARGVRSTSMSVHPATGWLRIDVEREGEGLGDEFGVEGYSANHTPVTSFTLLGPKERTCYVELLDVNPSGSAGDSFT